MALSTPSSPLRTAIEPWLTIQNAVAAIRFYTEAFSAIETYRMADPGGGLVVRLSVDGCNFWISGNSEDANTTIEKSPSGETIRLILVVADPDTLFINAIKAGATEVFPVGEEYGWRLGRLIDPFGLHWEIGHPLE